MYEIKRFNREIDYFGLKGAHIAIFGVSEISKMYYDMFFRDSNVLYFIDKNAKSGGVSPLKPKHTV